MLFRRVLPTAIIAVSAIVALRIALPPVHAVVPIAPNSCPTCEADGCSAGLGPGEAIQYQPGSDTTVSKCYNYDTDPIAHCCAVARKTYDIIDTLHNNSVVGYCYIHGCNSGTAIVPYTKCNLN